MFLLLCLISCVFFKTIEIGKKAACQRSICSPRLETSAAACDSAASVNVDVCRCCGSRALATRKSESPLRVSPLNLSHSQHLKLSFCARGGASHPLNHAPDLHLGRQVTPISSAAWIRSLGSHTSDDCRAHVCRRSARSAPLDSDCATLSERVATSCCLFGAVRRPLRAARVGSHRRDAVTCRPHSATVS